MRWLLPALALLVSLTACRSGGGANTGTYIALGDSLSVGVGASQPSVTAFVPLVQESLGEGFQLINLAHSGDTSQELLDHGHLDEAIVEIQQRKDDGDRDNDVKLVTLTIGGNDLLDLFFSLVVGDSCPDLEAILQKQECLNPLGTTFQRFESNLGSALGRLRQTDPQVAVIVITLYNPFSGSIPLVDEAGDFALEGLPDTPFPEGLNDIIRAQAQEGNAILVDLYPLFQGRADELVSDDQIHPNDAGYRVIAEAVIAAIENVL